MAARGRALGAMWPRGVLGGMVREPCARLSGYKLSHHEMVSDNLRHRPLSEDAQKRILELKTNSGLFRLCS